MKSILTLFVSVSAFVALSTLGMADEASKPPVYTPGLGEIMSLQQMRHTKLWLAGEARNWPLASYELDELKEGFTDAPTFDPSHDGQPIASMIKDITPGPIAALAAAIKAEDTNRFGVAYDKLSAACNSCHEGANHGFIHIQRPTESLYTDQDFSPVIPPKGDD
jgi:hypothetical protein